jgi:hypothetical protein
MNCCPSTSKWFLDMLSIHPGCSNLQVFFLDCPSPEMRFMFAKLLLTAFQAHFEHKGDEKDSVDRIVDVLLGLLQREVVDSYRFSTQYFEFLREYSMHEIGGPHLLQKNGLMRFITFLMEPPIQTQQRSWAPQQVREFRTLFAVIGNLMRQIDLTPFCKGLITCGWVFLWACALVGVYSCGCMLLLACSCRRVLVGVYFCGRVSAREIPIT